MKPHYSPYFKMQVLTALDANHGNAYQTAKQFHIHRRTLAAWIKKREEIFAVALDAPPAPRLTPSQQLEILSQQLMASLPAKIKSAGLGESLRAFSALNELRTVFNTREQRGRKTREKLAMLLEGYAKEHERTLLQPPPDYPGGDNQETETTD